MKNTSKKISSRDIFYFRQRQKNKVYQAVIAFFAKKAEEHGITKKDLAIRFDRDPAQITRWFSGPGNWTLDTISDLLLAMDAEMRHEILLFNLDEKKVENNVVYARFGEGKSKLLTNNFSFQTNVDAPQSASWTGS